MNGSDEDKIRSIKEHAAYILREEQRRGGGNTGSGDGSGGMENRVTRLETHMEYVRRDLSDMSASLKILPALATKKDLDSWRWQWIATGAAIIALILGGMGWLASRPLPQFSIAAPEAASTTDR